MNSRHYTVEKTALGDGIRPNTVRITLGFGGRHVTMTCASLGAVRCWSATLTAFPLQARARLSAALLVANEHGRYRKSLSTATHR